MDPKKLSILDYTYDLPAEKIALHPLPERDASRLLICQKEEIEEDVYRHIAGHLPENSFLVFNNTKVIRARIRFQKPSGGSIEIFCLEPFEEVNEYSTVMNKRQTVSWKCMIGGASKWKEGNLKTELKVSDEIIAFTATLKEKLPDAYVVEFNWQPAEKTFAEVLEIVGDIPLPPYIKRQTEAADVTRYQTIYAKDEGSVAAPTAGLHFTEAVFKNLKDKNIHTGFVTLHVGAGTFKPVKAASMEGHDMHAEWIDVHIDFLSDLLQRLDQAVIAVGTTSLRTLETLYWLGVKTILQSEEKHSFLGQWEVYELPLADIVTAPFDALSALVNQMKKNNVERLIAQSKILIAPGYQFRMVNAIVTNFHQPQSTLLLLVAAAIGDKWKEIYQYALDHNFRFLSYGDGCLIYINGAVNNITAE